MKNVNKINILKIFVKNLIGDRKLTRLVLVLLASILLNQVLGIVVAGDKEVPDPNPSP